MRSGVRALAILIAVGGIVDPSVTWTSRQGPAVEVVVPAAWHPDHARAAAIEERVTNALQGVARVQHLEQSSARVAIGRPPSHFDPRQQLFVLPLAPAPMEIVELDVPSRVMSGQQIDIRAELRARGLGGRASEVQLQTAGVTIATATHEWSRADETHAVHFTLPGQRGGTYSFTLAVVTDGSTIAAANTNVTVRGDLLRVLAYDPRPSWPLTFARRSLETDVRFEVDAIARNAPGVATTTGERDRRLTPARLQRYDAILIGGLDRISVSELDAIVDFLVRRGGTVILLPDTQIPAGVRSRLQLPHLQEILLEQPTTVEGAGLKLKASELLLPASQFGGDVVAAVHRDGSERAAIFSAPFGEGTVVVSGALDAWRHRGDEDQQLDAFMRSLTADAAMRADAPVEIGLSPTLAGTGEPVAVTAAVRPTEFGHSGMRITLPPVSAAITDGSGRRQMIRLWPTSRVGEFHGLVRPAREGRYQISVTAGSRSTDAVLTVEPGVTHPRGADAPLAPVASLTGGGIVEDETALRDALSALGAVSAGERVHPMRSPWWIVPFTLLLTVEWMLRRRVGLR